MSLMSCSIELIKNTCADNTFSVPSLLECYCLCHTYICSVCVCMCVCVYVCVWICVSVDRLHDLSGETESVYANVVKQPGNPGLVRVKA